MSCWKEIEELPKGGKIWTWRIVLSYDLYAILSLKQDSGAAIS